MGENDLCFVSLVGVSMSGLAVQAVANTLDELAPDDVEVSVLDDLVRLPPFDKWSRGQDIPNEVAVWAARVAEMDAVVVVSPETRGALPRLLTNVFGWLAGARPRPLASKAAAVITVSAGRSEQLEQDDRLRNTLATLGAAVLDQPRVRVSHADAKVDFQSACLRDADARLLIQSQLAALALLARQHRRQRSASE